MNAIEAWARQVTTGQGGATLLGTILAVFSGSISWTTAAPMLLGGIVLVLWPEKTGLSAAAEKLATDTVGYAPTAYADVRQLASIYQWGVAHGNAAASPPAPLTPANADTGGGSTGVVKAAAMVAFLLLASFSLAACVTKPGVNSTGTPTTTGEQVAGDAYVAYDLADAAWIGYLKSSAAKPAVVEAVEPRRLAARSALDAFALASVKGNAAAAQSAFTSALNAWQQIMAQSGVANVPAPTAP